MNALRVVADPIGRAGTQAHAIDGCAVFRELCWTGLAVLLTAVGCSPDVPLASSSGQDDGAVVGPCSPQADCQIAELGCRTLLGCDITGRCVFRDAPEGTPIAEQVPGDCTQRVCDGQGLTKSVAAPDDIPEDGNFCTLDSCNGPLPEHVLQKGVDVPCYTGPKGTLGAGICSAGVGHCDEQGQPGPCVGEILPQAETCDASLIDEDCDGKVNDEGANCFCGDGYVSVDMGEECDDANTLDDDACLTTCKGQRVLDVGVGMDHTCALLSGGRVKCWGSNGVGALGLGYPVVVGDQPNEMGAHLPDVDLGSGQTADAIAVGATHNCALLHDGRVKCWGSNYRGALGLGDTEIRGDNAGEMGGNLPAVDLGTGKTAKSVCAGIWYNCALLNDDSVKCWGSNIEGSLGLGDSHDRGDGLNEMGDNLPTVDLGTGKIPTQLVCKEVETCALFTDGSIKCWPRLAITGQKGDMFRGDGPNEMGDFLPTVNLGSGKTVQAVDAAYHACAIIDGGILKCWGQDNSGSLGQGMANQFVGDEPNEIGDSLPAVDLGSGASAIATSVGAYGSCALLGDGGVKCWGDNTHGLLGLGDTAARGDDPNEMGDNLPRVDLGTGKTATLIRTGYFHTCAVLNDGSLKCWGSNDGTLGLGDENHRGDEPGEMGDALPTVKLFSDTW